MSEMWASLPLQISGPKTTCFPRFRNLKAHLTAYIFGTKHDTHKRVKCVANYNGSPTSSQNDMNYGLQTASN